MSLNLDGSVPHNGIWVDNAPSVSPPWSFTLPFKVPSLASTVLPIWVGDKDSIDDYLALRIETDGRVSFWGRSFGSNWDTTGSSDLVYTANTVSTTDTNIATVIITESGGNITARIKLNGGSAASKTAAGVIGSSYDRIGFGGLLDSTPSNFRSVEIQDALWQAADDNFAAHDAMWNSGTPLSASSVSIPGLSHLWPFGDVSGSVTATDTAIDDSQGSLDLTDIGTSATYSANFLSVFAPSSSWDGTLTWSGRTPPTDPAETTFKPVARFCIPPHQDITADFDVPVMAFCKGGIARVDFWCEGNTFSVTEPQSVQYNGRPFEAYMGTLSFADFPATNGEFQVFAEVVPVDATAQNRVISLTLYSGAAGSLQEEIRYVDVTNGDDSNDGTTGSPFASLFAAKEQLRVAGQLDGARIRLRDGNYTYATSASNFTSNNTRFLTIEPDAGHSPVITARGNTTGMRVRRIHLKDVDIDVSGTGSDTPVSAGNLGASTGVIWRDGITATFGDYDNSKSISSGFTETYSTDCRIEDGRNGPGGNLVRDCSVNRISSDVVSQCYCAINTTVETIDTTLATNDPHSDVWQWFSDSRIPDNAILYGTTTQDDSVYDQPVLLKDFSLAASGIAMVNNEFTGNSAGLFQIHSVKLNHVIMYGNTIAHTVALRDDDGTADWDNFDLKGNFFSNFTQTFLTGSQGAIADGVDGCEIDRNAFGAGATGANSVTVVPEWNDSNIPTGGGNLQMSVGGFTLLDAAGSSRSTSAAYYGAYEGPSWVTGIQVNYDPQTTGVISDSAEVFTDWVNNGPTTLGSVNGITTIRLNGTSGFLSSTALAGFIRIQNNDTWLTIATKVRYDADESSGDYFFEIGNWANQNLTARIRNDGQVLLVVAGDQVTYDEYVNALTSGHTVGDPPFFKNIVFQFVGVNPANSNNATARVYVDGVLEVEANYTSPVDYGQLETAFGEDDFHIGRQAKGTPAFWEGDFAKFGMWFREASVAETNEYLNGPTPIRNANGSFTVSGTTGTITLPVYDGQGNGDVTVTYSIIRESDDTTVATGTTNDTVSLGVGQTYHVVFTGSNYAGIDPTQTQTTPSVTLDPSGGLPYRDDFTGPDGSINGREATQGAVLQGWTWSLPDGTGCNIESNELHFDSANGSRRSVPSWSFTSANQYMQFAITAAGTRNWEAQCGLRFDVTANSGIIVLCKPNDDGTSIQLQIRRRVSGSNSILQSTTFTPSPTGFPFTFRGEIEGLTIRGIIDGTERITYTLDGVEEDFSANREAAIATYDSGGAIDDFEADDLPAANSSPTDITLSSESIEEGNSINDVVGTLTATDADGGDSHTFTLVSGTGDTDNASFNINGTELRASEVFDFATKSSYSIRIQADDGTSTPYQEAFTITIDQSGSSQISYNGVTFTLDKTLTSGNFVTGEPWVVSSEAFNITGITPDSATVDGYVANGTMKDPFIPSGSGPQGFDEMISDAQNGGARFANTPWSAALNVDPAASGSIAIAQGEETSIVKSVRLSTVTDADQWQTIEKYVPLHVLASAPPADAYPPSSSGLTKTIWTRSDIDLTALDPFTLPASFTTDYATQSALIPRDLGLYGSAGETLRRFRLDVEAGGSTSNYSGTLHSVYSQYLALLSDDTVSTVDRDAIIDDAIRHAIQIHGLYTRGWSVDSAAGAGQGFAYLPWLAYGAYLLNDATLKAAAADIESTTTNSSYRIAASDVGQPAPGASGRAARTKFTEEIGLPIIEPDEANGHIVEMRYGNIAAGGTISEVGCVLLLNGGEQVFLNGGNYDSATNPRSVAIEVAERVATYTPSPGLNSFFRELVPIVVARRGLTPWEGIPDQIPLFAGGLSFTAGDGSIAWDLTGYDYCSQTRTRIDFRYSDDGVQWVEVSDVSEVGSQTGLMRGADYYSGMRFASAAGNGPWSHNYPLSTPITDAANDRNVVTTTGTATNAAPSFAVSPVIHYREYPQWNGASWKPVSGSTFATNEIELACGVGMQAGTVFPAPTYAYQWKRDGVNIAGETNQTYQRVAADAGAVITCEVTATNSEGSTSATTSGVTAPALNSIPSNELINTDFGWDFILDYEAEFNAIRTTNQLGDPQHLPLETLGGLSGINTGALLADNSRYGSLEMDFPNSAVAGETYTVTAQVAIPSPSQQAIDFSIRNGAATELFSVALREADMPDVPGFYNITGQIVVDEAETDLDWYVRVHAPLNEFDAHIYLTSLSVASPVVSAINVQELDGAGPSSGSSGDITADASGAAEGAELFLAIGRQDLTNAVNSIPAGWSLVTSVDPSGSSSSRPILDIYQKDTPASASEGSYVFGVEGNGYKSWSLIEVTGTSGTILRFETDNSTSTSYSLADQAASSGDSCLFFAATATTGDTTTHDVPTGFTQHVNRFGNRRSGLTIQSRDLTGNTGVISGSNTRNIVAAALVMEAGAPTLAAVVAENGFDIEVVSDDTLVGSFAVSAGSLGTETSRTIQSVTDLGSGRKRLRLANGNRVFNGESVLVSDSSITDDTATNGSRQTSTTVYNRGFVYTFASSPTVGITASGEPTVTDSVALNSVTYDSPPDGFTIHASALNPGIGSHPFHPNASLYNAADAASLPLTMSEDDCLVTMLAYPLVQSHATSTAFALGDVIEESGRYWRVTTAGTTAGSKPTFSSSNETQADGSVTWTRGYPEGDDSRSLCETVSVLHCSGSSLISQDSFRPGFTGGTATKRRYTTAGLQALPGDANGVTRDPPSVPIYEPGIDNGGSSSEAVNEADFRPYGQHMAIDSGNDCVAACADTASQDLIYACIQRGIDYIAMREAGLTITANGGWSQGRLPYMLFAAYALNDVATLLPVIRANTNGDWRGTEGAEQYKYVDSTLLGITSVTGFDYASGNGGTFVDPTGDPSTFSSDSPSNAYFPASVRGTWEHVPEWALRVHDEPNRSTPLWSVNPAENHYRDLQEHSQLAYLVVRLGYESQFSEVWLDYADRQRNIDGSDTLWDSFTTPNRAAFTFTARVIDGSTIELSFNRYATGTDSGWLAGLSCSGGVTLSSPSQTGPRTWRFTTSANAAGETLTYTAASGDTTDAGNVALGDTASVIEIPDGPLFPSSSWDGTLTWSGRTPPSDPTRTVAKPAARFAIEPHQIITGDFTVALQAFAKGGIDRVVFWCEGNTVAVTEPESVTIEGGDPFEAYTVTLDASAFPASDGEFEVYATIEPTDPAFQDRVISLPLLSNIQGTIPTYTRYADSVNGDDGTGDGSSGNPFATFDQACSAADTAASSSTSAILDVVLRNGSYRLSGGAGGDVYPVQVRAESGQTDVKFDQGASTSDRLSVPRIVVSDCLFPTRISGDRTIWGSFNGGVYVDHVVFKDCTISETLIFTLVNSEDFTLKVFYTGCTYNDADASRGLLNRDVVFNNPPSDVLTRTAYCLNVTIDGGGGDAHEDIWGFTDSVDYENILICNLVCRNADYQAIFLDGGSGNAKDVAFINFFYVHGDAGSSLISQTNVAEWDHVLFRHVSLIGQSLRVNTAASADTNSEIKGCVFRGIVGNTGIDISDMGLYVDIDRNAFTTSDSIGSNAVVVSSPDWNLDSVPDVNGNLQMAVGGFTLLDAAGSTRSDTAAYYGSFEGVASSGATLGIVRPVAQTIVGSIAKPVVR